jgi:hypothetical protein
MTIILFAVFAALIAGCFWPIRRTNALDWLVLPTTVLVPAAAMVILSGHPKSQAEKDAGVRSSEALVALQIAVLLFLVIRSLGGGGQRWLLGAYSLPPLMAEGLGMGVTSRPHRS